MPHGADGYYVSRIGPVSVPAGAHVVIRDQAVVASIPPVVADTKIYLRATAEQPAVASATDTPDPDTLHPRSLEIPALAASFGPSITHRSPDAVPPGATPFMLDGPAFPLVLPRFDQFGCEPPPPRPSPSSAATAPPPYLLLLHRGHCSFATKSHHAALAGARGVVVISHPTAVDDAEAHARGGFVVPGADPAEEEEETMQELVPLVLVANATGQALDEMVQAAAAVAAGPSGPLAGGTPASQIVLGDSGGEDNLALDSTLNVMIQLLSEPASAHDPEEDQEEHVDGILLGGYTVRNLKLHRKGVGKRTTP